MRTRLLLGLALALLIAACGADDGGVSPESTTTTASAPSTEPPSSTTTAATTTTAPPGTSTIPGSYAVAEAEVCVIGVAPGEEVNVRSGPGSGEELVGTLAAGAVAVHTTGWAARDENGDEWRQVVFGNGAAWVFSAFLTPEVCTLGEAVRYCVNEEACTDTPNLRTGLGSEYDVIDTLALDATGIQGTGASTLDAQGRTWVQVEYEGRVGWVAGWLVDPEPCEAAMCTVALTLHPDGIEGFRLGDGFAQVRTGLIDLLGEPAYEGEVPGPGDEPYYEIGWDGLYVSLNHDTGFAGYEYWGADTLEATTPEGVGLGATLAQLEAAYPLGEWVPPADCVEREGGFIAPSITAGAWYEFLFTGDDPSRTVASIRVGFVNEWC